MAKIIEISKDERLRLRALKDALNNQIEISKKLKKSKTNGTKIKKQ